MLHYKGNVVKIRNQKVQKQKDYNDCALFAIAFATTLCHSGDPTTKRYEFTPEELIEQYFFFPIKFHESFVYPE